MDDLLFGVHDEMLYARNSPSVEGAQWTGIVTQIAIDMLESGAVEAVVCVQSADGDRFGPKPVRLSLETLCDGCRSNASAPDRLRLGDSQSTRVTAHMKQTLSNII